MPSKAIPEAGSPGARSGSQRIGFRDRLGADQAEPPLGQRDFPSLPPPSRVEHSLSRYSILPPQPAASRPVSQQARQVVQRVGDEDGGGSWLGNAWSAVTGSIGAGWNAVTGAFGQLLNRGAAQQPGQQPEAPRDEEEDLGGPAPAGPAPAVQAPKSRSAKKNAKRRQREKQRRQAAHQEVEESDPEPEAAAGEAQEMAPAAKGKQPAPGPAEVEPGLEEDDEGWEIQGGRRRPQLSREERARRQEEREADIRQMASEHLLGLAAGSHSDQNTISATYDHQGRVLNVGHSSWRRNEFHRDVLNRLPVHAIKEGARCQEVGYGGGCAEQHAHAQHIADGDSDAVAYTLAYDVRNRRFKGACGTCKRLPGKDLFHDSLNRR